MSKEQIKIICDDARALTDNDNKMIRCHINIKHFNWLIEQVQELENLVKCERNIAGKAQSRADKLEQQNKRYREYLGRLQRATNRYPAEDMAYVVNKITSEALEETK